MYKCTLGKNFESHRLYQLHSARCIRQPVSIQAWPGRAERDWTLVDPLCPAINSNPLALESVGRGSLPNPPLLLHSTLHLIHAKLTPSPQPGLAYNHIFHTPISHNRHHSTFHGFYTPPFFPLTLPPRSHSSCQHNRLSVKS